VCWLFASLTLGLIVYGVTLALAISSGVWFDGEHRVQAAGWRLAGRTR